MLPFDDMGRIARGVPQKVTQQIGTQKVVLAAIWGIDGFHVLNLMTEQHCYNIHFFFSNAVEALFSAIFPEGRKPHFRRLSVHLDNCRVHCSKAAETFFADNGIARVPHPSYSPDLTPSKFWLFGNKKGALARQRFTGSAGLLDDGVSERHPEVRIGTCLLSLGRAHSIRSG
jgi:hypothetical protein